MKFEDWRTVKLKDIATINMGQSPKSEFYNDYEGVPFLQGTRTFKRLYPDIDTYTLKVTKTARKGDILFSVRAPVGDINFAPVDLCIGRGLASLSSKSNNQKFLYYLLIGNFNLYESQSTGTIFSSINKKTLEELEFTIPSNKIQRNIGEFLWSFDKKIELNKSIISNLEELAQTLFKRWFVDFEFPNENGEPYKSNGGKMVESELGMIPSGWDINILGDLIEVIDNRGKTPPLEPMNTSFPIIDVKALSGEGRNINYENCSKFVNEDTYQNWFRSGHPEQLDVLFSTVGSLASIKMFFGSRGCIAQNVVALRGKSINPYFLYQYLKNDQEEIKTLNIGSVQPSIKVTHLIKKKLIIPTSNIYVKYNSLIEILSKKIYSIQLENENLKLTRDTLLPKLLSGEIDLPDTLEVTEDVPVS